MADKPLKFTINADQLAANLQTTYEDIKKDVERGVQGLTAQTHAKVIELANDQLKGFQLKDFLGEGGENVRWSKVGTNMWSVEIDESKMFYNDGRKSVSMLTDQWLLKNAKTAKDGSKYAVIPFRDNLRSNANSSGSKASSTLGTMTRNAIRNARTPEGKRIPIRTIEKNKDGTPKLGILHKIKTQPMSQSQAPSLYSSPRSQEMALKTGLKAHGGIFKLEGLAISQRKVGAGVKREAVTFRVASSKQIAEGRWMYPAITPHNFLQKAFDWAVQQWPQIQREIELKVQAKNRK